jgi:hypothetical protein
MTVIFDKFHPDITFTESINVTDISVINGNEPIINFVKTREDNKIRSLRKRVYHMSFLRGVRRIEFMQQLSVSSLAVHEFRRGLLFANLEIFVASQKFETGSKLFNLPPELCRQMCHSV